MVQHAMAGNKTRGGVGRGGRRRAQWESGERAGMGRSPRVSKVALAFARVCVRVEHAQPMPRAVADAARCGNRAIRALKATLTLAEREPAVWVVGADAVTRAVPRAHLRDILAFAACEPSVAVADAIDALAVPVAVVGARREQLRAVVAKAIVRARALAIDALGD